ncbi:MAG: ABC transporter substrate-binding protein [Acidobacteria bacterium]|nr:ABC transporter substrate-binding protein [Acidobacteriota bacterium]
MFSRNPRLDRAAVLAGVCTLSILMCTCRQPELVRGQAQAEAGGPVTIATAWPWESRATLLYGQGLQMAVDETNAAGGVLGRPLEVLREDDHESVDEGRLVARRLAQDDDVVAVIGHMQSYVSLPAAAIYDLFGIVHLAPTSTDPRLTQQGYRRLFRMTFTDRETGAQMADFAAERGYDRIAIYYIRNAYGRGLANAFEERALERGVGIADRQSYDPNAVGGDRALTDILASWRDLNLRAIFIAGEPREAAAMIRAARERAIDVPVLGGDALGTAAFVSLGGRAVEGTVLAAAFHPGDDRETVRQFSVRFRERYGRLPDASAALAYDAVRLLAHGMTQAESVDPDRVADALRATAGWRGVTGPVAFTDEGDLVERAIGKVVVRNGRLVWLGDGAEGE